MVDSYTFWLMWQYDATARKVCVLLEQIIYDIQ